MVEDSFESGELRRARWKNLEAKLMMEAILVVKHILWIFFEREYFLGMHKYSSKPPARQICIPDTVDGISCKNVVIIC